MKLYTKRGDAGLTDLFGGKRVSKDALRVEAYGTVDELNSAVGLALCACENAEIKAMLTGVQSRLFDVGAELATPAGAKGEGKGKEVEGRIEQEHVTQLERHIDWACEGVPPMRSFVLPAGVELACRLHLARSICRRAERLCVALSREESVSAEVIIFLNRLSDLLFALARKANHLAGVVDVAWIASRKDKA
jgi:cob(I)alamin adenosyltransferase